MHPYHVCIMLELEQGKSRRIQAECFAFFAHNKRCSFEKQRVQLGERDENESGMEMGNAKSKDRNQRSSLKCFLNFI